ncbi:MAG: hypothetical protein QM533_02095 [Cytophagales bacterium]|nr:hypothetical protein [Cytophagales bacterium]
MNNLKNGGQHNSGSGSTASPNQKPATLNAVRMLTPSEIESLRLHKHETAAYVKAALRGRTATAAQ